MERYNRAIKKLNTIVLAAGGIMLLAMMAIIMWQVIARYFLKVSTPWCEELARYLFIYVIMIGSAACVCTGGHVSVTLLVDRLPKKVAYAVSIFSSVVCIFFYAVLVYTGYLATVTAAKRVSSVMSLNMGAVYAALPLCGLLMIVYGIMDLAERIKSHPGKEDAQ